MNNKPLRRLPQPGDKLTMQDHRHTGPVIVREIIPHGNLAHTVAVEDERGRVWEVRKEYLSKSP